MAVAAEKATRAGAVYAQIREDIFQGALEPGQRLRLVELAQRFSVSQSVIREALTRLSGQGLVVATPQQGFSVVTLSLKDLDELTEARRNIESLVLRQAVERGDITWESAVVAAHHHLAGTPMTLPGGEVNHDWLAVHESFHQTLLEGCGNDRLLSVALSLRDAATVYRRWSFPIGHDYDRDIAGEHQALVDAVVARDADAASRLLAQHIDRTSASLRAVAQSETVRAG
ncbi:GntR family transcriptional regulator [Streptomyces violaceusniger]|uniref:GntR family transcriptional regulator n=1 Tax=Streptomyces violaceusniger TaxID=68280 RepID=A0A4D4KU79_STRVO|nr:GntR family transcriptional regulator [Streptomyces violaceusniger]